MWKHDGATTSLVADIRPGSQGSSPSWLTVFNNALYFSANDGVNGAELWKYDGSTASLAADIRPGAQGAGPGWLTPLNGTLYMSADDNVSGRELWRYDGNVATLAADIQAGAPGAAPRSLEVYNNKLYFSADDGVNGRELWQFDGVSAALVPHLLIGIDDADPGSLAVFNGELYFAASNTLIGRELWKYDGFDVDFAADIAPGAASSNPAELIVYNNALYFRADVSSYGPELWRFDGTNASLVADIQSGTGSSNPEHFAVFGNTLYFSAHRSGYGEELWRSNGTSANLTADVDAGPAGSSPQFLTGFNGTLYFTAFAPGNINHLWRMFCVPTKIVIVLFPKPFPAKIGSPFEWVMDITNEGALLDTTMGVFALAKGRPPLLLSRIQQRLPDGYDQEGFELYATPRLPEGLPSVIGFSMVMFNNETGELLATELSVVGIDREPTAAQERYFERRVERLTQKLTLFRLNAMEPGDLERLIGREAAAPASEIAFETELLQNVPNPFNPETWIPYRLAETAEVKLVIYDATGQHVCSLELGRKPAGVYTSRSNAIYWDGRNEVGEPVASGIYVYRLTAGDYTAARKMVIVK